MAYLFLSNIMPHTPHPLSYGRTVCTTYCANSPLANAALGHSIPTYLLATPTRASLQDAYV